jgi:hypothetical protein
MEHSKYRWQKQRRCRATASLPLLMVLVLFASSAECFAGLGSTTGWATGASSRGFRVQAPPLATHSQRRRSAKCALRMSDEVVFEKDVVEFLIPPDLRVQLSEAGIAGGDAAETMLGAIVDELGPSVAPLSVREEVGWNLPSSHLQNRRMQPRSHTASLVYKHCRVTPLEVSPQIQPKEGALRLASTTGVTTPTPPLFFPPAN